MSTTVITGATSGLGLQTARLLANQHPKDIFIITSRKLASAKAVSDNFPNMIPLSVDLSEPESVQRFIDNVQKLHVKINGVIANAGSQYAKPTLNSQGIEDTFATNVIGQYLLIQGLQLLFTDDAKIILVSSDTHDRHKFTGMPNPQYLSPVLLSDEKKSSEKIKYHSISQLGQIRYTTSKLAVIYLVHAFAINDPKHTYVSFNPGFMPGKDSGLVRDYNSTAKWMFTHVFLLMRFVLPNFVHTVKLSSQNLAEIYTNFELKSGKYWDGNKVIPSSDESYDTARETELWRYLNTLNN
ncbi:SDR family NAD(P)-dependent oxidoreductase [Liquorilactobacillus oeni]|uniref:Uncharacterized protein n=1 Tax=Liquorilactobacillus oeni DSM 19972 TaxID=1423777 RepID=A0A0R1M928_9LACO|nr:SDR family NAD(P)-dependent oxidoreductase [Liquorilactobacillus oeni]KRL04409.1 hypothetical protein FD46_GL001537 [Liquorilactobacillus oeni DSM 19972]